MALSCFVGSFTVPAGTGNKSVSGVGFQPKCVIFFSNRRSADGKSGSNSENDDMPLTILGIANSSSSRAVIYNTNDFSGGNPTASGTECIHTQGAALGTFFAADFISMDSDGFTVNFTTANATAYIVNYCAVGGADLTNVGMVSFTSPGSTGNNSQNGVGFKPDCIIFIGGGGATTFEGLGIVSSTAKRGANSSNFSGVHGRYQRTNQAYVEINSVDKRLEADLVSFDSDGWTLNFTTVNATTSTIYGFCFKGGQFTVDNILQKTSTGTQQTTGVGFLPKGLILTTVLNTALTTINTTREAWHIGAASDTTHRGVVISAAQTRGVTALDRANIYKSLSDATNPSVQAAADLSSFDNDGFTLNYGTADATAREILYFAFGSAPSACDHALPLLGVGRCLVPFVGLEWLRRRKNKLKYWAIAHRSIDAIHHA